MQKKSKIIVVLIVLLCLVFLPTLLAGVIALPIVLGITAVALPGILLMCSVALPVVLVIAGTALLVSLMMTSVAVAGFLLMAWVFFDWVFYIFIGRLYGARMIDWAHQAFPSFQTKLDGFLSFCNRHAKKTVFILVPLIIMATVWALPYSENKKGAFLLLMFYWCAYVIRSFFIILLGVQRMPLISFVLLYYLAWWMMNMVGSWAGGTC
jgi:hypothetical protein